MFEAPLTKVTLLDKEVPICVQKSVILSVPTGPFPPPITRILPDGLTRDPHEVTWLKIPVLKTEAHIEIVP